MRKFSRRPLLTEGVILSIMLVLVLAGVTTAAAAGLPNVFNVKDYGAVGDGAALETAAINKAIKKCNASGGGTVLFPAGTYLSGSIHLKSNVTLHIDKGATILGASNDIGAYDRAEVNRWDKYQDFGHSHFHNALMWGEGLENIAITGPGTINGGGMTRSNDCPVGGGDKAISLKSCKNIVIKDVTILQGGHFAIITTDCEDMKIANLKIRTARDGINLVGCRNVEVYDCDIEAVRYAGGVKKGGDDAIAFKSDYSLGRKLLSENITIKNCRLSSGCNALQFGSETVGDFRNIRVSNITIEHADKAGIGIVSNDGATIDGVTFSDISMTKVANPIFMMITDRLRSPESPAPGKIRNITFNNITCTDAHGYIKNRRFTSTISGMPDHPIENVVLKNVKITYKGGGTKEDAEIVPPYTKSYSPRELGKRPSYGFYCRYAKGLEFHNVEVGFEKKDLRPALIFDDADGVVLDNFNAQRAAGRDYDVVLRKNVKNFSVRNSPAITVAADANKRPRPGKSAFEMNGWQLHEYDVPKLKEAIERAPDYGVNFFIFSHNLFRSVEGFLASGEDFDPVRTPQLPRLSKLYRKSQSHTRPHAGWQKDLLYLGSLAEQKKIPYYLWIHELDELPPKFKKDGKADLDHPDLFGFLENRYERLLKVVPNCAGFVLTFHESDHKIFRSSEVSSELAVAERIYRLTKLIYDVAKRHKKQLILRNFFYEPLEMKYFSEAIARLPDDLIVMSKTTFHEFDPFYPPDSMHGNVGNKRQIIEIDLGVEKALSHHGAYAQLEYIRRYVRRAREKGLAGMVGRARLKWAKSFEDIHEINLYGFRRFMQNPDLSVEQVAGDWARGRYPELAVPHIVSAMLRTQYINHHGRHHLRFWLTKSLGAQWGKYSYYFGHLMLRSQYKWTQDPADKELETKLYHPDMDTYNKLVAEKDEVLRQVKASIADIEKAATYLNEAQKTQLEEDFNFLLDAAILQKEWVRAYFAQRMFIDEPKEEYRQMAEDALGKLEQLDKASGVSYGLDSATGHRYNIDKFVAKMRERMMNRASAIAEDEKILKKIRLKMDVKKN